MEGCALRRKVVPRIEVGVTEELEDAPMELIASRFRGHQNRGTAARSPFRRVIVGEHLKFLDRVNRRQDRDSARRQFVVIVAVQQPIRTIRARSAHRQRIGTAGGRFAAGAAVKEAVRIGFLRYARRKRGKLHEVAAVQW